MPPTAPLVAVRPRSPQARAASGTTTAGTAMASAYPILTDSFAGTAGAAIAGSGGSPVQSASDTWTTFSPYPSLVFKVGGGAIAATFSGTVAISTYPLTGVAQDGTYTFKVATASLAAAQAHLRFHRTADGNNEIGLVLAFPDNQIYISQTVAGTTTQLSATPYAYALGTTYTVTAVVAGTSLTLTIDDGTTTTPVAPVTIPTGTGTVVLIGQVAGSAGDLTFSRVAVTTPGPATGTLAGSPSGPVGTATPFTVGLGSAVPAGGAGLKVAVSDAGSGTLGGTHVSGGFLTIPSGSTSDTFTVNRPTGTTAAVAASFAGIAFSPASIAYTSTTAGGGQLTAHYATPSLATVYFVVFAPAGAWDGTALEPFDSSHWPAYAIAGSDAGAVGIYRAGFPAGAAAGTYTAYGYLRAGGTAAPADTLIATEKGYWDGTDFGPGGAGGGGPFPGVAPANWINRAAFAADMKADGTMRASSSGAVVHLDAADARANAMSGTLATPMMISVVGGAGAPQLIPIASVAGAPGSKDGTVMAGFTVSPALGTDSAYYWTDVPALPMVGGSVQSLPPAATVVSGSGSTVVVTGYRAGSVWDGQRLCHVPSGEVRAINSHAYSAPNYTLTLAAPFASVAPGDAVCLLS